MLQTEAELSEEEKLTANSDEMRMLVQHLQEFIEYPESNNGEKIYRPQITNMEFNCCWAGIIGHIDEHVFPNGK